MTKKSLLALVLGFCGLVCAAAHDYRVFYYVRDKHGVHGPVTANPKKPYAGSIQAGSVAEARRMILKDDPDAVQIEIHQLD
jgi:hypothetical protein